MSDAYPESVSKLIEEFSRLPGIGRRSAERLAFFVLKSPRPEAMGLADAIARVKDTVRHCSVCWNLADADPCPICRDERRDASVVLVVEQPRDLISLEQTGMHGGVYHVLLGRLDPLDGVGPDGLTVEDLLARLRDPERNARRGPGRGTGSGAEPRHGGGHHRPSRRRRSEATGNPNDSSGPRPAVGIPDRIRQPGGPCGRHHRASPLGIGPEGLPGSA